MEVIMFFIFVEEMKQSKSQQKPQLFSQLKSDWEWDWNLKILNCPRDPAESWLERFREMGPDPELIQSLTGKEVCFNGKQQMFCGSFVSLITRNLLSLSPLFYFYSWLQGVHQKRKTSWGQLCVWSSTQKSALEILWEDGNPLLLGTFLLGCPTCFALVFDPSWGNAYIFRVIPPQMPVVESEGFCLGSYMKMHGPRISGKPKEIGFLHGPIDRVVTIGVIKDVLCRVFDSRKALSRTNLAFVASGMRFFFRRRR